MHVCLIRAMTMHNTKTLLQEIIFVLATRDLQEMEKPAHKITKAV